MALDERGLALLIAAAVVLRDALRATRGGVLVFLELLAQLLDTCVLTGKLAAHRLELTAIALERHALRHAQRRRGGLRRRGRRDGDRVGVGAAVGEGLFDLEPSRHRGLRGVRTGLLISHRVAVSAGADRRTIHTSGGISKAGRSPDRGMLCASA